MFTVLGRGKDYVWEVLDKVKDMMNKNMPSTLLVYYSGHGIQHEGEDYLQTSTSARNSVGAGELGNKLAELDPNDMLVILDCCRSGAFSVLPEDRDMQKRWRVWASCSGEGVSASWRKLGSRFTNHVVAALRSSTQCYLKACTAADKCSICEIYNSKCRDESFLTFKELSDCVSQHMEVHAEKDGFKQTPVAYGDLEDKTPLVYAHCEPLYHTVWFRKDGLVQHAVALDTIGPNLGKMRGLLVEKLRGL